MDTTPPSSTNTTSSSTPLQAVLRREATSPDAHSIAFPIFSIAEYRTDSSSPPHHGHAYQHGGHHGTHSSAIRVDLEDVRQQITPDRLLLAIDADSNTHIDLNQIPVNFAERDDRFLAHTTLPPAFLAVSNDGNNNDDDDQESNSVPRSDAPPAMSWHPLSTKLGELLIDPSSTTTSALAASNRRGAESVLDISNTNNNSNSTSSASTAATTSSHNNSAPATFPNLVCEAEAFKELVLAPFLRDKPMSLMVHRVGDTILLDAGTLVANQTPTTARGNRKQALASKIVYFSVAAMQQQETEQHSNPREEHKPTNSNNISGNAPSPSASPFFSQVLRWKFDDLSALVGTRPTPTLISRTTGGRVSLLVKEVTTELQGGVEAEETTAERHQQQHHQPPPPQLSKLESLDSFVQNVLERVPNVAICTHKDGIVQGIQIVPTGRLPSMCAVPYEPVAVLRHSRDVLKWLQEKTRDGGSFVLLKDPNSNNGSSLCLYRIGNKMSSSSSAAASPGTSNSTSAATPSSSPSVVPPPRRGALTDIDASSPNTTSAAVAKAMTTRRATTAATVAAESPSVDDDASISDGWREFDYPLALLSFRMAQSLDVADAEALRLFSKSLSLFHEHDDTMAAFRAVALVSCAEHLRASSPLSDAEALALRYARDAIDPLATIFLAESQSSSTRATTTRTTSNSTIVPVSTTETAFQTAVRLTHQLLKFLTGIAAVQQQQNKFVQCMRTLALVQAVLMLRRDEIPSGLLMQHHQGPGAENVETTAAAAVASADDLTSQLQPQQSESTILLQTMSRMDCIVGDIFHALLVSLIQDAVKQHQQQQQQNNSTAASSSSSSAALQEKLVQVDAVLRMAAVTAQDVGLSVLSRFYPNALEQEQQHQSQQQQQQQSSICYRFVFPPQINVLGFLESCSANIDSVCEAGAAAYSRAAAMIVRENPTAHRDISRRAAGLENIMADYYFGLARLRVASTAANAAAAAAIGTTSSNEETEHLLTTAFSRFDSAQRTFARVGDDTNAVFMLLNKVKVLFVRAELAVHRSGAGGVLTTDELKQLLAARDTLLSPTQEPCCIDWLAAAAATSTTTSGGGDNSTISEQALTALRHQFIQFNLHLFVRCINGVIGPGTSFSRDTTFSVLGRCFPEALWPRDPNASVLRLLLNLEKLVLDEFAQPALRVARLVHKQIPDAARRCHLMMGELQARFAATAASSQQQQPQQQQQFFFFKLASWVENEIEQRLGGSGGAHLTPENRDTVMTALQHAATHFKVVLETAADLPVARFAATQLLYCDVMLRRAKLLLEDNNTTATVDDEACEDLCMKTLSVLYSTASWLRNSNNNSTSGRQQPQQQVMLPPSPSAVQQRLVTVLMLVMRLMKLPQRGAGRDEKAAAVLKGIVAELLKASANSDESAMREAVLDALDKLPAAFRTTKKA